MKLYLDDDSVDALLVRLLMADGHDVVVPHQLGRQGWADPSHFLWALSHGRALLTRNHDDFELLHQLVIGSRGRHSGVIVVRRDNNPKRDLDQKGTIRALRKLVKSGLPIANEFIVLNHWR